MECASERQRREEPKFRLRDELLLMTVLHDHGERNANARRQGVVALGRSEVPLLFPLLFRRIPIFKAELAHVGEKRERAAAFLEVVVDVRLLASDERLGLRLGVGVEVVGELALVGLLLVFYARHIPESREFERVAFATKSGLGA